MGILHLTFIVAIVLNGKFYKTMLVKAFDLTFTNFFLVENA